MTAILFPLMLLIFQSPEEVHGRVVGPDGIAISDAIVTAKSEAITRVTRTVSSGEYRFDDIPSGDYLVTAEISGQQGASLRATLLWTVEVTMFQNRRASVLTPLASNGIIRFFDNWNNGNSGAIISSDTTNSTTVNDVQSRIVVEPIVIGPARVSVPGPNMEVNLVILKSAVSISGRVPVLPRMSLPSPLKVTLTGSTNRITAVADLRSNGTFEFDNVPPGSYSLGLIPNLGVSPLPIAVDDQNLDKVELGSTANGVRVSGSLPGVERYTIPTANPQWAYLVGQDVEDILSSKGTVLNLMLPSSPDASRLATVPQTIGVNGSGEQFNLPMSPIGTGGQFEFLTVPPGVYSLRTIPETGMASTSITVKGAEIADVQAGIGVRVRGEVVPTNLGTRPPEVIRLTAAVPNGPSVSAVINEYGSFEFPNVGPGTYRVLLDGRVRPKPSEITVEETDTIIRVESPYSSWIRGRVQFAGANPPPETVAAIHVALNNGYETIVSPDGSFRLPSNDGEYDFFAKDLPEGYVVKSAIYGSDSLLDAPVKVDASAPAREIMLTLERKSGANLNER